jgi:hypothetical protein
LWAAVVVGGGCLCVLVRRSGVEVRGRQCLWVVRVLSGGGGGVCVGGGEGAVFVGVGRPGVRGRRRWRGVRGWR